MREEHRRIRLDVTNTSVTFAVRWLGVVTVRGRFAEVAGAVHIPDGCVDRAEVAVEVAAGSVRTGIAVRDRHLRGPRFLDARRFPRILFQSTRIERPDGVVVVAGVVSLRGREREVSLTCPIEYAERRGRRSLVRLSATFSVSRVAHGVGVARGIDRVNPLLYAIGPEVTIHAEVFVPAAELLPALLPALGG